MIAGLRPTNTPIVSGTCAPATRDLEVPAPARRVTSLPVQARRRSEASAGGHRRRRVVRARRRAGLVLLLALGCAPPSARFDERAEGAGLLRSRVAGTHFVHAVFRSPAGAATTARAEAAPLHLYIEGDALPARALRYRPADPTPEAPLALELMRLDPSPSLLLGRPCQHGLERCDPRYWTVARYSDAVVESMATAARRITSEAGEEGTRRGLVLIGWSGGGTLAMLLAERLENVRAVVTIAGNLDVASWSRHHAIHPLEGSLDPALRPPLDPRIVQIHWLGARDDAVPAELVRDAIARQTAALTRLAEEATHREGWTAIWPDVLRDLEAMLSERGAPPEPKVEAEPQF